jgi:hypothetical protein
MVDVDGLRENVLARGPKWVSFNSAKRKSVCKSTQTSLGIKLLIDQNKEIATIRDEPCLHKVTPLRNGAQKLGQTDRQTDRQTNKRAEEYVLLVMFHDDILYEPPMASQRSRITRKTESEKRLVVSLH